MNELKEMTEEDLKRDPVFLAMVAVLMNCVLEGARCPQDSELINSILSKLSAAGIVEK